MEKNVLAFDFGASSGRAMLGRFNGEQISLQEVHRFDNNPVSLHGTFYWDVLCQFYEIKQGLSKAAQESGGFASVGVDTWGVDYGLLDRHGDLLQNPVHYRDRRTEGLIPEVEAKVGGSLYRRNGIQLMDINTVFQLYAMAKNRPDILERAGKALLMPDLFSYFLSGNFASEYSIASTTELLNPHKRTWDTEQMQALGIPTGLFPDVVPSGTVLGPLTADLREELNLPAAQVVATAGHDTAAAVVAAPAESEDFIYISCGTWSLFGTELKEPVITEKSEKYNITNEGGYGGTIRFLKNIIGLWLIQETRRQYRREGQEYGYADLEEHALAAPAFRFFIDPDDPAFVPPGNLPRRVREYCQRTGQGSPETTGEIMRCIYESIAMKYRYTYELMKDCTGKNYRYIHMVGGGTKDKLLCSMAAAATGLPIMAGPIEATAMGNVAVQLMAVGDIGGIWQAREIIRNSFKPVVYQPQNTEAWSEAYGRFLRCLHAGKTEE